MGDVPQPFLPLTPDWELAWCILAGENAPWQGMGCHQPQSWKRDTPTAPSLG